MGGWQLISDDGSLTKRATIELRTTEMPGAEHRFESRLFAGGGGEVLARYRTRGDAHRGHHDICRRHGLIRHAG